MFPKTMQCGNTSKTVSLLYILEVRESLSFDRVTTVVGLGNASIIQVIEDNVFLEWQICATNLTRIIHNIAVSVCLITRFMGFIDELTSDFVAGICIVGCIEYVRSSIQPRPSHSQQP